MAKFLLLNPFARRLVAIADETLGYSLIDRYRTAEADYSEFERIAFLVTCLALAQWSEDAWGTRAEVCAGPSFGGTPAAVYSGALGLPDALRMTAEWGRRIEEYFSREHRDVVTQSCARLPEDLLAEVLAELAQQGEWYDVACYVDRDFHMVSLREGKLDWLQKRLRSAGGLPLYTMRPPMHSDAFRPLRDRVEREVFDGVRFDDPTIPVVSDHDGTVLTSGDEVRTMLLDGMVRPVRWLAVVETLKRNGVGKLHISGPDNLWGRVRCMTQNFDIVPIKPRTALQPRHREPVA
ncbi:ACP S-malonyltransferase [Streptomyces sp. NPDC048484]|uniref:ACP S-malonyltransferase n=1 Tax=Streptomyces sp. NPDC048484 TaxID=3155146 RepID=UPI0034201A2F